MLALDGVPTQQQAVRRVERRERHLERLGADQEAVAVGQHGADGVGDVEQLVIVNPQVPVAAQVGQRGVGPDDNLLRGGADGEAAVEIRRHGRRHLPLEHQVGVAGQVVELEQDAGHGVADEEVEEELLRRSRAERRRRWRRRARRRGRHW